MPLQFKHLTYAPYFETYLAHLNTDDLGLALSDSAQQVQSSLLGLAEEKWEHRYADGKWSIKEVLYHVIETEIIFNFRALTIGRENDAQVLKGFDENAYIDQANLDSMASAELLGMFNAVRATTVSLAKTFDDRQMKKTGEASGHEVQVEALFFVMAGHTLHHLDVIKKRYLS